MTTEQEQALQLATEAGHILLENGAEISRVEETMTRIASAYGVEDESFFVLSNGIIATGQHYARAEFIPIKGTQLARVVEVNQLSRDVCDGHCSLDQLASRLEAIRHSAAKPWWELLLGIAVGVSAFSLLFGGSLTDAAVTFAVGLLLGSFMTFLMPHMSRFFGNVVGGLVGGWLCIIASRLGLGEHLPNMIIGTIIALVPGVPFTNGIRDIAHEDYIAGATRMLDAFMIFLCIALGVCVAFILDSRLHQGLLQLGAPTVDLFAAGWAIQLPAALLGTIGFSVLFGAPRRYYVGCGLCGMAGWALFLLLNGDMRVALCHFSPAESALFAAMLVALLSQLMAQKWHCPTTLYLICGIIPLVPGGAIFWTAYYMVASRLGMAAATGFVAIKVTIAIAVGIILAGGIVRIAASLNKRAKQL